MPLQDSKTLETDQESVMGTAKEAAGVVNQVKPVRGDVGLHA